MWSTLILCNTVISKFVFLLKINNSFIYNKSSNNENIVPHPFHSSRDKIYSIFLSFYFVTCMKGFLCLLQKVHLSIFPILKLYSGCHLCWTSYQYYIDISTSEQNEHSHLFLCLYNIIWNVLMRFLKHAWIL